MGFKEHIIEWIPKDSTTSTDLNSVIDVRVTRVLDAKNNILELILDGYSGVLVQSGEFVIKPDDTIKVYATEGFVDKNNNEHLMGIYTVLNTEIQPDGRTFKLTAADKTYLMLSKVYAIRDLEDTINNHVEAIVQTINETGVTQEPITTVIDNVRSDSSDFPTTRYTSAYKTAYDAIDELSQTAYTGDNYPYMFWFDEDDTFHWEYPGQTPESDTFVYGQGSVIKMKVAKTEAESISMIIYNAGEDLNASDRIEFKLDPTAGSVKNRIKYNPWLDISQLVRQGLKDQFDLADTENSTLLTVITNEDFIDLLDERAVSRCMNVFAKVGQGLWSTDIDVDGLRYTPGKFYTVSSSEFGFPPTNLRLIRIVHTLNKNGWLTKLELREDPESEENI